MSELLTIGAVADATGVTTSALRYYDDRGVISPAARIGGQRRFDPTVIGRVNFIQRSQQAGFSLDDIVAMLDDTAGQWRALVDRKLVELTDKRARIDEMIELLTEVRACGCDVVATCDRAPSC